MNIHKLPTVEDKVNSGMSTAELTKIAVDRTGGIERDIAYKILKHRREQMFREYEQAYSLRNEYVSKGQ